MDERKLFFDHSCTERKVLERTRVRWPVVDQALNLFDLMFPNTYRKFDAKYVLRRSVPKDLKDFLAIRGIDITDAS